MPKHTKKERAKGLIARAFTKTTPSGRAADLKAAKKRRKQKAKK